MQRPTKCRYLWKVADKFEIGRAQVQTILQKKESLLMSFEIGFEQEIKVLYGSGYMGVPTYLSQEECFKRRLKLLLKA